MWLGLVAFVFDSHVSDFPFLVEAHGRSMGHRMVECASIPLSLSLYMDFQSAPGEAVVVHWGAVKSITPGYPPRIRRRVEPAP